MINAHHLRSICGTAVAALGLTVASATATDVYFDDGSLMTNNASVLGTSELFEFGFGTGIWSKDIIAPEDNTMGLLIMVDDANTGGHGISAHVDYPQAFNDSGHGLLMEGNVLRLSCFIASDAGAPVDRQDWQFALLKIEFLNQDLGDSNDTNIRIFDTDRDHAPPLVTSYANSLSTTNWTQFVFEYVYDTNDFNAVELEEVRPVIIDGDFEGRNFNGNIVVDNIRLEVFVDQAAADASPVDPTLPGPLPQPFVYYDIVMYEDIVDGTVVEWDGQLGVHYVFEYSDDGGTLWQDTGVRPLVGTGERMQVADPAGPVSGRTYRISTPPAVPLGP